MVLPLLMSLCFEVFIIVFYVFCVQQMRVCVCVCVCKSVEFELERAHFVRLFCFVYMFGASSEEQRATSLLLLILLHKSNSLFYRTGMELIPFFVNFYGINSCNVGV